MVYRALVCYIKTERFVNVVLYYVDAGILAPNLLFLTKFSF